MANRIFSSRGLVLKLALVLLIVGSAGGLFILKSQHDKNSSECPPAIILGIRGSDAAPGPGIFAEDVWKTIGEDREIAIAGLAYPAEQVSLANYNYSVATGSAMVHQWVTATSRKCPAAKLFLVGHSQGAHVVNKYVAEYDRPTSVELALMAANPARSFSAQNIERLSFPTKAIYEGDYTVTTDGAEVLSAKSSWRGRALDFCASKDQVCNSEPGREQAVNQAHLDAYTSGEGLALAVDAIGEKLSD